MKKNFTLMLLTIGLIVVVNGCCSISMKSFQVKKVKNKELNTAQIYYSISQDGENEVLFFSDFSIAVFKVNSIIFARNKKIIPVIVYGLGTVRYEPSPELASQTNFFDEINMFDWIKKINYYPKKKMLVGCGFSRMKPHEVFDRKITYFIIVPEKTELTVFCFDSKASFEKRAYELLKPQTVELEDTGIFFEKTQKTSMSIEDYQRQQSLEYKKIWEGLNNK